MTNPTNELYLLSNVDLDPDYNYTLDFDNETAQHTYFENKIANVLLHTDDYSYIRADQSIKVYANIDTLNSVNYLMYKNADKWYYGFVTKKEYVSDKVTRLIFKIDPLQTFMFDYSLEESFIDREHQDRFKDNKPVYNRVTENLEIGKNYRETSRQVLLDDFTPLDPDFFNVPSIAYWYLIFAKEPLGDLITGLGSSGEITTRKDADPTTLQNNLNTNMYIYLVPQLRISTLIMPKGTKLYHDLRYSSELAENPLVLSIKKIYNKPSDITLSLETGTGHNLAIKLNSTNYHFARYKLTDNQYTQLIRIKKAPLNWVDINFNFDMPVKPTSYNVLKNIKCETKLFTQPYKNIRLEKNGVYHNYGYENFDDSINFKYYLSIGFQGNEIFVPVKYLGKDIDREEALQNSSQNDLILRTDAWQNYELNNKASMNGGLIAGAVQTAASIGLGVATGGIGLAVAGGQALSFAGQIAGEMLKREDIKNQPDEIKPNSMDTILNHLIENTTISCTIVELEISIQNAIFNYFYHYGYKCNDFKKPNVRSRYYFNYIKTIGANIKSNIDADYKAEIASIFDKGITIWHYRDATTFKGVNNFEYENAEITLIGGTNGN